MQIFRWAAIVLALVLIASCFLPWIRIPSRDLVVSGFHTEGTNFGKPGLFHVVFAVIFILLLLLNRIWSKRIAFFICAINIAWAFRNLMILSSCFAGECPGKLFGLYLSSASSVLMMILAVFSDYRWKAKTSPDTTARTD